MTSISYKVPSAAISWMNRSDPIGIYIYILLTIGKPSILSIEYKPHILLPTVLSQKISDRNSRARSASPSAGDRNKIWRDYAERVHQDKNPSVMPCGVCEKLKTRTEDWKARRSDRHA